MTALPQQTRVVLRPLGSALPLGLAGLAIASLLVSAAQLQWVPVTQGHTLGVLLLAGAVPLQLLACAYSFPARDGAAGTGMGVLAVSWLAINLTRLLSPPGATSDLLGVLLLATALLLAGSAVTQGLSKPLAGATVLLAAARFALTAIYELSAASAWRTVAGIAGLIVVAGAVYLVWALQLEDAQGRPVLPATRRDGRAADEEPGVRSQL